jgi:hypothetical protein
MATTLEERRASIKARQEADIVRVQIATAAIKAKEVSTSTK